MAADKSPKEVQELIGQFRQWLRSQTHLPNDIEDRLLKRFLHSCYYDLHKAKSALGLFFDIRTSAPELLNNRDLQSASFVNSLKITNLARFVISGNRNLWIWQLNDPGLERYDYALDARLFFISTDAWLLTDDLFEDGDISILDVKDVSLKFLAKFNLSIARKLMKYQEDAIPIRLKQIHVINAPPFIDKLFALMKPILKQDMTDMLHFHTPKSDTLYEFIDKKELPVEFGGENGRIEDHMKETVNLVYSQKEKLCDDNLWKSTKKSKNKADITEDVGSFRTLAID